MYSQYFGHFLLAKGYINGDQLQEALNFEKDVRVKLGTLAMNAGFMLLEQIEKVHIEQTRVDKKFGEIAIERGFLTHEQLEKLLSSQKRGHLVLGQCLIDKGYMSLACLKEAIQIYGEENHLPSTVLEDMNENELVGMIMNFGDTPWSRIYSDYMALLLRNFVRLIDDVPVIHVEEVKSSYHSKWLISQKIKGKFNMVTGFGSDDEVSLRSLAELYSGERHASFDEYAKDAVSELLNLHNGIFLVNMSNNGVELKMQPQTIQSDVKLEELPECFKIKLTWLWGSVDMIIY